MKLGFLAIPAAAGAILAAALPFAASAKVEKSVHSLTCDGVDYIVYVSVKETNKGTFETLTYQTADYQFAGQEQFENGESVLDTFAPNDDGCE